MSARKKPPAIKKAKRRFRRRRNRQSDEPSAVDLIEEGINLLRRTPLIYWAVYLSAMAPFVVAFLFFWTEMASSGLAEKMLIPGSLILGVLFIWLKVAQVYFAKGMREALVGKSVQPWGIATWLRVFRKQAIWQPTGLIVIPIMTVLTVPFASTIAFYQNLLTADQSIDDKSTKSFSDEFKLARIWPEQSWALIALFFMILLLCWINWLTMLYFVPFLLKSLLGIETLFSMVGANLLNSTSMFACLLLSYVVVDPVAKAAYLLRSHYCKSRTSGEDLRLRFRRSLLRITADKAALIVIGLVILTSTLAGPKVQAQDSNGQDAVYVDPAMLDESIDDVLEQREFAWRFPRDEYEVLDEGGFFAWLSELIREIREGFIHFLEKLFSSEDEKSSSESVFGEGIGELAQFISYLIIALFVIVIVYMAVKAFRSVESMDTVEGTAENFSEVVPDISDEDVSADMLPRNRWVEMAKELIAKGEYRLALRAYFLAQLSAFSTDGLIVIQKAKSNREYARELSKRGHGKNDLISIYRSEVRLFESTWYGDRSSGPNEIREMEQYLSQQGVLL